MDHIRIKMLGGFEIYVNDHQRGDITEKTRKGSALMQILLTNEGRLVPSTTLMDMLWSDEKTANPESALKTLISRLRATLNQIAPGLGKCIVAGRGGYFWRCADGIKVNVDLYDLNALISRMDAAIGQDKIPMYRVFLQMYTGDLLKDVPLNEWSRNLATGLHARYLQTVYRYVEYLKSTNDEDAVINIARTALDTDSYDETLHIELMDALVRANRTNEAMLQYKLAIKLYYSDLGIRPSDKLLAYYKNIANNGKNLEFSLDSIRVELQETSAAKGAFICEYSIFKEIYNLQMRNLERLGSTMYLCVIQIIDTSDTPQTIPDPLKQDYLMTTLIDVLRECLRKGDTVSQFSTDIVALLLPMVHYETGRRIMERVRRAYYRAVPNSAIVFHYCLGPLSSQPEKPKELSGIY